MPTYKAQNYAGIIHAPLYMCTTISVPMAHVLCSLFNINNGQGSILGVFITFCYFHSPTQEKCISGEVTYL